MKNLEELADYHRGLLQDSEWRYQQAMEQLSASQRTMETLTKALPAAVDGKHSLAPPGLVALRKRKELRIGSAPYHNANPCMLQPDFGLSLFTFSFHTG